MSGKYDDIIDLPHHVSSTHPRMPMADRAAQFSPFQALTGYGDAVNEAARLTDQRAELTESAKAALDEKLQMIADHSQEHPAVKITCFQPDAKKEGGSYATLSGLVKRIDPYERAVVLRSGEKISIDDILEINSTTENIEERTE